MKYGMKVRSESRMTKIIAEAVHETLAVAGINALLATSMFPSSQRLNLAIKKAA